MKKQILLLLAAVLLGVGSIPVSARDGPMPPPPPGRSGPAPGRPGLPPPLPRTPLPPPLRQIQVARPAPLPGAPVPPPPVRLIPPSPYQMVPPPPARQPGVPEPLHLLPPSPYQRSPETPVRIPQPWRTSSLGPYRFGPVVSFTSLTYLPPLPRPVHVAAVPGGLPNAAEQEEMKVYWAKVRTGTASAEERAALEMLVRKYPQYDFARKS